MKLRFLHSMLLLTVSLSSLPALAQTAYRCGDSYSQSPCPGGTAVDITDQRTPAQKSQTEAAAQRDARQAQAMEKARLKKETEAGKADAAARKATEPTPAKSKAHEKKKNQEPAHFTAREAGNQTSAKKNTAIKSQAIENAPPASKP